MNKFKDKLVAVKTQSGDKLIGLLVDNPGDSILPGSSKRNGVWLARKTHLTFLGNEEVKEVRLAKPFEEEVDHSRKMFGRFNKK